MILFIHYILEVPFLQPGAIPSNETWSRRPINTPILPLSPPVGCRRVLPASEASPSHSPAREDCGSWDGERAGECIPGEASGGEATGQSVRVGGSGHRQDGCVVGDHQSLQGNLVRHVLKGFQPALKGGKSQRVVNNSYKYYCRVRFICCCKFYALKGSIIYMTDLWKEQHLWFCLTISYHWKIGITLSPELASR